MKKEVLLKNIKVKKWHNRKCFIEGTDNEYYFPTGETFFANFAGNRNKHGNHHFWMEMGCSDPACDFRAVINENLLSDLIKA